MHGHTVVGEQEVQESAENAPLWGPSVEDQRGGDVVTYPHHLGAAHQEVQDPVAQGGVETQALELDDAFGGYYGTMVTISPVHPAKAEVLLTFKIANFNLQKKKCCFRLLSF